jgi:hypothetical protein
MLVDFGIFSTASAAAIAPIRDGALPSATALRVLPAAPRRCLKHPASFVGRRQKPAGETHACIAISSTKELLPVRLPRHPRRHLSGTRSLSSLRHLSHSCPQVRSLCHLSHSCPQVEILNWAELFRRNGCGQQPRTMHAAIGAPVSLFGETSHSAAASDSDEPARRSTSDTTPSPPRVVLLDSLRAVHAALALVVLEPLAQPALVLSSQSEGGSR